MSDLKTLKDLDAYEFSNSSYGIYEDAVLISELKSEAVKWVKSDETCDAVDSWIKHFFNLTSEDFKND